MAKSSTSRVKAHRDRARAGLSELRGVYINPGFLADALSDLGLLPEYDSEDASSRAAAVQRFIDSNPAAFAGAVADHLRNAFQVDPDGPAIDSSNDVIDEPSE